MSECDHIIAGKNGMDGGLYQASEIDLWRYETSAITFQYCPLCGHKHDWNALLGAVDHDEPTNQ